MPRKNREEYNAYMRDYMKNKKRKSAKGSADQDDQPEALQPAPLDPNQGTEPLPKELLDLGKSIVEKQAAKGDKTMDWIAKAIEHAPTVIGLVQQFAKGMAQSQAAHQQQQPQQPQYVPPPPHYGTSKAVQFLDDPAWIAQRDAYLAQQRGMPVQIAAPQYQAQHYQQEARQRQQRGIPTPQSNQPTSMAQLNAEAEADMRPVQQPVDPQQGISSEDRPKETSGAHAVREAENRRRKEAGEEPLPEEPQEGKDVTQEQIINEMREDNKRAIQFVVQWINGQSDDQLLKKLEKDDPFKQYYPMLGLLPIQYRDLIVTLSGDEVLEALQAGCPEKIKLLEKHNKKDQLIKAWTNLQAKLKGAD